MAGGLACTCVGLHSRPVSPRVAFQNSLCDFARFLRTSDLCRTTRTISPAYTVQMNMDHHLLHSALSGDDKLEKYELYLDTPKRNLRAVARLGDRACGHPHIVHGGAIASLLDDAFGCLFFAARVGNGFTAKLEVNYRRPLPAGTEVHILTRIDRIEGRKVRVW